MKTFTIKEYGNPEYVIQGEFKSLAQVDNWLNELGYSIHRMPDSHTVIAIKTHNPN